MSPPRGAHLVLNALMVCAWIAIGAVLAHLSTVLNIHTQYLAFLPSVILCSRFYDFGAAVMSEVLSVLALWDWFIPPDGFALPNGEDAGHLIGYVLVSSFLCWLMRRERHSNAVLVRENFELGYKVSFLTRALQGLGAVR